MDIEYFRLSSCDNFCDLVDFDVELGTSFNSKQHSQDIVPLIVSLPVFLYCPIENIFLDDTPLTSNPGYYIPPLLRVNRDDLLSTDKLTSILCMTQVLLSVPLFTVHPLAELLITNVRLNDNRELSLSILTRLRLSTIADIDFIVKFNVVEALVSSRHRLAYDVLFQITRVKEGAQLISSDDAIIDEVMYAIFQLREISALRILSNVIYFLKSPSRVINLIPSFVSRFYSIRCSFIFTLTLCKLYRRFAASDATLNAFPPKNCPLLFTDYIHFVGGCGGRSSLSRDASFAFIRFAFDVIYRDDCRYKNDTLNALANLIPDRYIEEFGFPLFRLILLVKHKDRCPADRVVFNFITTRPSKETLEFMKIKEVIRDCANDHNQLLIESCLSDVSILLN